MLVLRPMRVSLKPRSCSQSDASGAPRPKLNAQHALARQRTTSVRVGPEIAIQAPGSGSLARLFGAPRGGGNALARQPVLEQGREVRAAQGAGPIRDHLLLDLAVQLVHARPVD